MNPNYPNFRPASSSGASNGGGSGSGVKKQHKYPKRLNQNKEKRVYGEQQTPIPRQHLPTAEEMYNSRTNQDRDTRNNSPIKPLRNFNNWVKGVLIYKYVPTQGVVLDISCGKGGDLFKYHFRNIRSYVGVDIASSSLSDCIQRYNGKEGSSQFKFPITLIHADVGKVCIHHHCRELIITEIYWKFPSKRNALRCCELSICHPLHVRYGGSCQNALEKCS